MSRKHHYLKTLPLYFMGAESGKKTFEVRFNDRDYQVYDILHLQEWLGEYTGREREYEVTYVLKNCEWVKDGYAILGIKPHGTEERKMKNEY